MQKKLLVSLVIIGCSSVALNELNADVRTIIKQVTQEDLHKVMGDLELYVENVTNQELSDEQARLESELSILQRLIREKDISEYKTISQQEFEKALADEIAGDDGAIQKKSNENACKHVKEENNDRKKESDHYIGWFGAEATPTSSLGKEFAAIRAVKQKKDEINKAHTDLVTEHKKEVSTVLIEELKHQKYIFASVYLKELRSCSEACRGDKDRFVECLLQKTNKGNWQDIENPKFFKRFAGSAYKKAAEHARSKKIYLNTRDIENSAQKGKESKSLIEELTIFEVESNGICSKIFNPQTQEVVQIDLTEENKEKPGIFEDPKNDQNDPLSQ